MVLQRFYEAWFTNKDINKVLLPQSICQHMLKLKETARPLSFNRHCYLYLESEPADTVYILEYGMIMLTKLLPNGQEVGIIMLTGKNFFGHCEVLSEANREHQAMALTECKIWAISAQAFLEQTKASSEFALALAKLQNERLRHVEQHIRAITQDNVSRRLTTTLLEIAVSNGCDSGKNASIKPCPTHQDLAVMIASTRETVSAIMSKLRKQNIIDFDRKEIRILNKELLVQF